MEIPCWTEFYQKRINKLLQGTLLIALAASKINDVMEFKGNFDSQIMKHTKKKKVNYAGVYIETTKSQ